MGINNFEIRLRASNIMYGFSKTECQNRCDNKIIRLFDNSFSSLSNL